ncbi:cation diffusion facilitator family transporter [Bacillus tianshenii]|nr:cation diffusion facilitator family transporter [Bacillus tianshenii]
MKQKLTAETGAYISIFAYLVLSAVKLFIAISASSDALKADGLNNVTDILASVAVLIGIKISKKPRDDDHPYGHSRAENISSLLASFIMFSIGIEVLIDAFQSLFHERQHAPNLLAAWTALGSAAAMYGVYAFNLRLANNVKSSALKAAAKDNLSDALVSIGTAVGILASQFQMAWIDPLAAFVVGLVILKTAIEIFRETTHMLTDGFDEKKMKEYEQTISEIDGVMKVEDVKARMQGNDVILDATIKVDPSLNVIESHEIADDIEQTLKEEHHIEHSHIHIEPDECRS